MERLWNSDLGDGTFRNPVLYADFSDPDVIRVDDTFYMTASSFNYIPGLPILTSKDLVNWELKNYAIKTAIPYADYDTPAHARGIWAPSIRFHQGTFYIFVGMPDEGIFMLETKEPLGEWSEPKLVLKGKGLIDPCPIWEDNGTAYVVHGYAKSRIGFKSMLGIFPISPDGRECVGDDVFLYDGTKTNPTIEGPKVYKRNGYYYIFAPAGGVRTGWQTVLRSKQLYGPYEERIVMHQGSSDINGPHQGGLVDTGCKEEWFLHFQDAGVYGRIVHAQPVIWKQDWPIIGVPKELPDCGEPQHRYPMPKVRSASVEPVYLEASDSFQGSQLGLQWQWMANSRPEFFSLSERPHTLRLYSINASRQEVPVLWDCPNLLTQKLICPAFTADIALCLTGLCDREQAGILMIGGEYVSLAFRRENGVTRLIYLESSTVEKDKKQERILWEVPVNQSLSSVVLRLTFCADRRCHMAYSYDGTQFTEIPFVSVPTDHTWVGAKFGVYSVALDSRPQHGFTDVLSVTVTAGTF